MTRRGGVGGGVGGGRGGRGGEGERRGESTEERDKWKGPSSEGGWRRGRDEGPMKKYEEPAQPVSDCTTCHVCIERDTLSPRPSAGQVAMPCWMWRIMMNLHPLKRGRGQR